MHLTRRLSIPIILGTPRQGRLSEHVARVIFDEMGARDDIQTQLIDVRKLRMSSMDAGEQNKDKRFSDTIMRAGGGAPQRHRKAAGITWQSPARAGLPMSA